ncbi:MAG TPA: DUF4261 domain-containing protein [Polyangia bacterium]|jgi:hypothetical protein
MSYEVLLLLESADAVAETVGAVEPPPSEKSLAVALDHTRDWPDAKQAIARARAAVRLADELPSEERLAAFLERVAAACAKLPCVAVWWIPAERLLPPRAVADAARDGDPLRVAVNVRLFHVEEGRSDERVMDTVGLAALALPDVQCHFFALDVAAVAAMLEEAARYLYDEGDVIGDGDTVAGSDGAPWLCRREDALVDPRRDVVDVTPPAPHAARRT